MASSELVRNIDRPAERLWLTDRATIDDRELLALLIGSGMAGRSCHQLADALIGHLGGIDQVAVAQPHELAAVPGIGMMRAARIVAGFELARRHLVAKVATRMLCADDVFGHLHGQTVGLRQEVFWVIAIDARGRLLATYEVARGGLANVEVAPREVFRPLIRVAAAAGVVAHNHPSGDPSPSDEDIALTRRLIAVASLVGIPLVDHVVLGNDSFHSMAQEASVEFAA